ncbi:hypothetical protein EPA93_32515 [Ktedonosporobacter rubrisoli]|uniref:Uncharacterized protein n=1 Tax=Ktedonosporobacter rubrisoli TaxID=2509675 RepID=A0A4P6JY61_KTERU|nr:hypothetical protein [Ktedonosporobacter rubrisoli]QBD80445.1 hypothetical protein EPA93_32515 [Ktedonosporobacter rubrisoli]
MLAGRESEMLMCGMNAPSRQAILVILDQLSRAKIIEPVVQWPQEKYMLGQTIETCAAWLEYHKISYRYDPTICMYVLDTSRQEAPNT